MRFNNSSDSKHGVTTFVVYTGCKFKWLSVYTPHYTREAIVTSIYKFPQNIRYAIGRASMF